MSTHRKKQEGEEKKILEGAVYLSHMQIIFLWFWELLQIRIIYSESLTELFLFCDKAAPAQTKPTGRLDDNSIKILIMCEFYFF